MSARAISHHLERRCGASRADAVQTVSETAAVYVRSRRFPLWLRAQTIHVGEYAWRSAETALYDLACTEGSKGDQSFKAASQRA